MQRPKQLPDVKGNMVFKRPSLTLLSQSPNVSRSWSAREGLVRAGHRTETRLTRSYGDHEDQESKVLEWCQKNNINMVRRLPKLDPNVLTTKGVNTEKFLKVVDEPPIIQKKVHHKPPKTEKLKAIQQPSEYCQYCQRAISNEAGERPRSFSFTSPYHCVHCGASNSIEDSGKDAASRVSTPESENIPKESINEIIRRGDPSLVVDHRNFTDEEVNYRSSEENTDSTDIMWRDDRDEYRKYLENIKLEDGIDTLKLYDKPVEKSTFLTESNGDGERPVPTRMAWDVEENANIAIVTKKVVSSTHDSSVDENNSSQDEHHNIAEKSSDIAQENNNVYERSQIVSERAKKNSEQYIPRKPTNVLGTDQHGDFQDTKVVFNHHVRSKTTPDVSKNERKEQRSIPGRHGSDEHVEILEPGKMTEYDKDVERYNMMESPVANGSVGLSRVALMRLTRQSRSRNRGARVSSGGTRLKTVRDQEPRTRSHDPSVSSNKVNEN